MELTEEEKAEAKEKALKAYQAEEMRKLQQRNNHTKTKPKPASQEQVQPSLFDF